MRPRQCEYRAERVKSFWRARCYYLDWWYFRDWATVVMMAEKIKDGIGGIIMKLKPNIIMDGLQPLHIRQQIVFGGCVDWMENMDNNGNGNDGVEWNPNALWPPAFSASPPSLEGRLQTHGGRLRPPRTTLSKPMAMAIAWQWWRGVKSECFIASCPLCIPALIRIRGQIADPRR